MAQTEALALACDRALLETLERTIDPRHPEAGPVRAKVLGYGEITTVLALEDAAGICVKRMPMFASAAELADYSRLYHEFLALLHDRIGVRAVPSRLVEVGRHRGMIVLYIVQQRLDADCVVQRLLGGLDATGLAALLRSALGEAEKVFRFNAEQHGAVALAIDGQLSNWGLRDAADAERLRRGETVPLDYIDTSTPLMRIDGREQLDSELFLRAAPPWLRPLLRRFVVAETIGRYYDRRAVAIDMIANLIKERRADAVPMLVAVANDFLAEAAPETAPLSATAIADYYRSDARIWRLYLGARRIDRATRSLLGKPYPYVLPAKVHR